jgi:hypothetical protein
MFFYKICFGTRVTTLCRYGTNSMPQCCGSGIRCVFECWIRDPGLKKNPEPGSRMEKNPDPGDEKSRFIFPRVWIQVFWLTSLKHFYAIRIGDLFDPGSGIRYKHLGSTTLMCPKWVPPVPVGYVMLKFGVTSIPYIFYYFYQAFGFRYKPFKNVPF